MIFRFGVHTTVISAAVTAAVATTSVANASGDIQENVANDTNNNFVPKTLRNDAIVNSKEKSRSMAALMEGSQSSVSTVKKLRNSFTTTFGRDYTDSEAAFDASSELGMLTNKKRVLEEDCGGQLTQIPSWVEMRNLIGRCRRQRVLDEAEECVYDPINYYNNPGPIISVPTNFACWDTSQITSMRLAFYNFAFAREEYGVYFLDPAKGLDITGWDTSAVTHMGGMFRGGYRAEFVFNQDISGWDVSSVRDMGSMFRSTLEFNQNIDAWDVSNVQSFRDMFWSEPFNQCLSTWPNKVRDDVETTNMFKAFGRLSSSCPYASVSPQPGEMPWCQGYAQGCFVDGIAYPYSPSPTAAPSVSMMPSYSCDNFPDPFLEGGEEITCEEVSALKKGSRKKKCSKTTIAENCPLVCRKDEKPGCECVNNPFPFKKNRKKSFACGINFSQERKCKKKIFAENCPRTCNKEC